jgi:hypothetical protein
VVMRGESKEEEGAGGGGEEDAGERRGAGAGAGAVVRIANSAWARPRSWPRRRDAGTLDAKEASKPACRVASLPSVMPSR